MIKKILVLSIFTLTLLQAGSFDMGMKYFMKGKYSKALPHFIKASNQGHKEAQFYLANMYEKGLGVERDNKKAIKLFKLYTSDDNIKTDIKISSVKKKTKAVKKQKIQKKQAKKQTNTKNSKGKFSKRYKKYYNPELQGTQEVQFN